MDNRTNQAWTERLKGENKIERSFSRTIKAMSRPKPAAKLQISESLAYCATTRARIPSRTHNFLRQTKQSALVRHGSASQSGRVSRAGGDVPNLGFRPKTSAVVWNGGGTVHYLARDREQSCS